MKSRELRGDLERAGGVLLRKVGDHHVYRFPNGERFSLPMGGGHSDASPGIVHKVAALLRRLRQGG